MTGPTGQGETPLAAFSDALAAAVERAGTAVARVEARRRQPASGIVWAAEGLVLTADHVLEREEDLTVGLPNGEVVQGSIVGRDPSSDLALLRVGASGLTPLPEAPAPRVGHLALLVARPGAQVATSLGIVSSIGRTARPWRGGQLESIVRTDAIFYPGFSGGALVDIGGRLIGLATSRFGNGRGSGLVLPVDTLRRVSAALLQHGRVRHGFLGIGSQPVALPEALRRTLGLAQPSGLIVMVIEPDGPAARAGLMLGDVLVTLGGQPIQSLEDLRAQLGPEQVGQTVAARVIRGGELRELMVTIGERG